MGASCSLKEKTIGAQQISVKLHIAATQGTYISLLKIYILDSHLLIYEYSILATFTSNTKAVSR